MGSPRIVVEDSTGELLATTGEVTFGTRIGCSVVFDDPIAAARHCQFGHDGRFVVRDLGSVTGTWLDGERVTAWTELRDGGQVVFGATRALAKVELRDGTPTLMLQLKRNDFWWRKAGKKVFDNDPDAMVRAEVGFGRFPALRTANRLAMVAAAVLLVGGAFTAAILEPLADAGPLQPTHALVTSHTPVAGAHEEFQRCRALADQQGCNVCHATGRGTPESKCTQCHADFVAEATRRHPYIGDGKLGPLTGMVVDAGFCVVCHRDHQGRDWLKPASAQLVGKCEACHGDGQRREDLEKRVPPKPPPPEPRPYATWVFPHDAHVKKQIDCAICHTVDAEVKLQKDAGFPDDPARHDFATVPFETCASCHVPDARASGMTAAQQESWRAKEKEHQWTVAWHGTDDGGVHCTKCHAKTERGGNTAFGPEMKTVMRPRLSPAEHARNRARYTTAARSHTQEFAEHAKGAQCTSCHANGSIGAAVETPRPFWHALHLEAASLAPGAGAGGAVSTDTARGCLSCHRDILVANGLLDAEKAAFHWPETAVAQAACTECHREGDRPLSLRATSTAIAPERRAAAADFPHDVHLASRSPVLAEGCFACHTFERPEGGSEFALVPRTKASAADCTQCHAGHDNVGGGQCKVCHPTTEGRSNAFLLAARVAPGTLVRGKPAPAEPTRPGPGKNPFSHLSRGHVDSNCSECHDPEAVGRAKDLATVPVPDDATPACRACHLKRQFHWR